jgi:hypothetical protein
MYAGYLFFCNDTSLKECLKQKRLSCPREKSVDQEIETDSVVFLFNKDSNTLVGPFTAAVGPATTDLEPGTWTEEIDMHDLSENIVVEWEELHEMRDAQLKLPFLEDQRICRLSQLQTQELLDALRKAPLFHEK